MGNLLIVNNMAKTFWSAIYETVNCQLPEKFANPPIISGPSPFNPFAPAAKRLSDRPENLHMGWKKIKNKNTF